jgi:hypothetical protein
MKPFLAPLSLENPARLLEEKVELAGEEGIGKNTIHV